MDFQCEICHNTEKNIPYTGREMMFCTKEEFLYFKCPVCGCLQIAEIPASLEKYYPDNYYSYKQKETSPVEIYTNSLIRNSIRFKLDSILPVYYLSSKYKKYHRYRKLWLSHIHENSSVLDIGCGKGSLLKELHIFGFKNLTGIDPYINEDTIIDGSIRILKREVYDLNEKFDFVMLHHAFEHMPNPHDVFNQLNKIVADNGRILIRIPLTDGFAWRKYEMNWFQVDAPRHLFLHTVKSIKVLSEEHGLEIESIKYDSTYHQFSNSEKIAAKILNSETIKPSLAKRLIWKFKTKRLNSAKDGDQACFILKKKL